MTNEIPLKGANYSVNMDIRVFRNECILTEVCPPLPSESVYISGDGCDEVTPRVTAPKPRPVECRYGLQRVGVRVDSKIPMGHPVTRPTTDHDSSTVFDAVGMISGSETSS